MKKFKMTFSDSDALLRTRAGSNFDNICDLVRLVHASGSNITRDWGPQPPPPLGLKGQVLLVVL